MSYISAVQPAPLADLYASRTVAAPTNLSPELPVSSSARLSTGLEVTLMLATLSGLSLTLCTIAAGAF